MGAMREAGIDVQRWLRSRLGSGEPGLGHELLAQLALQGARVWTVNFDELIEAASLQRLAVCAWPAAPDQAAEVWKPHGTLSEAMIFTREDVLPGLRGDWASAVAEAVAGRVAVFFGYSGRDLDFRPVWPSVLERAVRVVWFELDSSPYVETNRRWLQELPAAVPVEVILRSDPAEALLEWCQRHNLVGSIRRTVRSPPSHPGSSLEPSALARARFCEVIGDEGRARRAYLSAFFSNPADAVRGLARLQMNHGSRATAMVLRAIEPLVPTRHSGLREFVERKRLSILANMGAAEPVLVATADYESALTSNTAILRSMTLRTLGDLDEAASVAEFALEAALRERHANRAANAGYQYAQALVWADRHAEARGFLDGRYELIARMSSNRWVAWRQFLLGAVNGQLNPSESLMNLETAELLFRSEGLLDGLLSVYLERAVLARSVGDSDACERWLDSVERLGSAEGTFYLRRNRRVRAWSEFERAELDRAQLHSECVHRYRLVAERAIPLLSSLGYLGLGAWEASQGRSPTLHAKTARQIAERLGAGYQLRRADALLCGATSALDPIVFF